MSIKIRELTRMDVPLWLDMYRRLWPGYSEEALLLDIERILGSSKRAAYVAEHHTGRGIGFAEYALRDYANGCVSQPVPFLEGIWVDEAYRSQGVARALFAFLEQKARQAGFSEFGSDVDQNNFSSQVMHERFGFEPTERVIFYRKRLTP